MPAAAVVDAFKNLIRHGKHHQHPPPVEAPPPPPPPPPQTVPIPVSPRHHPYDPVNGIVNASHREAAQLIVDEERQERSKMPVYPGLDNFHLLDKMGDGAFSNVYKAVDVRRNARVAVKVVRKYELNASQRSNILKEVQIMRGTQHLSIVKLLSFSESPEHYFLVLELMDGGELFHQIVKLTYFSETLSRHVILQVAEGIRYLHEERGVVHRDIKPENLLFERIPIIPSDPPPVRRPYDEEKEDEGQFIHGVGGGGIGRVKIADFGLSKVVWNEQTMTPCGTVGYTAPEIVKDERYSKSVDLWALGCVLYTLLCGFPPFYDESINVLTEKVARGYFTFLSPWWDDISLSSKDLISHLLCVDSTQRYTIDEFLDHPWCTASEPPPPPTPHIYAHQNMLSPLPLDSPLLSAVRGGRGHDGKSPGLATLKEAFDITYAVHRMEEEGSRRRKFFTPGGTGPGRFLDGLNEDEEEEADENEDSGKQRGVGTWLGGVGAQQKHPPVHTGSPRRARKAFELDLDGATLLGRRNRRTAGGNGVVVSSPLSGKSAKSIGNSPLRLDRLTVRDDERLG